MAVAGGPSSGVVENGGSACKNPWWLARGKRFPVLFCWLLWGVMYPVCRRSSWPGKILEADTGGQASSDPGLRRWRGRVSAGLEPEGGHLVFLVVERLERRCVAVPPNKHRR